MKTRTLHNVPEKNLEEVVADFNSEGCTVEPLKQANGKYTVIARCPNEAKTRSIIEKVVDNS